MITTFTGVEAGAVGSVSGAGREDHPAPPKGSSPGKVKSQFHYPKSKILASVDF
jgi:hypothetical protein